MTSDTRSPLASAYFRFLQLARAVEALPDGAPMDANESALLEAVVLRWHEGHAMTVREAINLAELGSPATLHKRLVRLRQADLVTVQFIEGDRRSKLLIPTEKGLDYVSKFGNQLTQAGMASVSAQA